MISILTPCRSQCQPQVVTGFYRPFQYGFNARGRAPMALSEPAMYSTLHLSPMATQGEPEARKMSRKTPATRIYVAGPLGFSEAGRAFYYQVLIPAIQGLGY